MGIHLGQRVIKGFIVKCLPALHILEFAGNLIPAEPPAVLTPLKLDFHIAEQALFHQNIQRFRSRIVGVFRHERDACQIKTSINHFAENLPQGLLNLLLRFRTPVGQQTFEILFHILPLRKGDITCHLHILDIPDRAYGSVGGVLDFWRHRLVGHRISFWGDR